MDHELRFLNLLGYTRDIVNNKEGFLECYDIFDTKGILVGNMRIENNEVHMSINNEDIKCTTKRDIDAPYVLLNFYLLLDGSMVHCRLDLDDSISIFKDNINYSLSRFGSTTACSVMDTVKTSKDGELFQRTLWINKDKGLTDLIDFNEIFNYRYVEKYANNGTDGFYVATCDDGVRILEGYKGCFTERFESSSIDEVINSHTDGVRLFGEVSDILNKCPFKGDLNEALGFNEDNDYKLVRSVNE